MEKYSAFRGRLMSLGQQEGHEGIATNGFRWGEHLCAVLVWLRS